MKPTEPLRYEGAAHQVTCTGWACRRCSRFYGDNEHMARWCCASDFPCKCGGRIEGKGYTACRACRDREEWRREQEKWDKAVKVDWDDSLPLCDFGGDTFLWDEDEVYEYVAERLEAGEEVRLQLCEPHRPEGWRLCEAFEDYLPEVGPVRGDPPAGWEEVEQDVNDWLKAAGPWSYYGCGPAIRPESLRAAFPDLPWPPCPDELAAADMVSEGCPNG